MKTILFTLVATLVTGLVSAGVANIEDGWYFIKNPKSGLYLQVSNEEARAVANIEIGSGSKSDGQKWKVTNVGDGYVTLTSALGDFNIDIANGEDKNGANVQIYDAYGGDAQQFVIMTTSTSNTYTIGTKISNGGKALDIENDSTYEGTNVCQWTNGSKGNQLWVFEKATDGCWAKALGYECCKTCQASQLKDESGDWGIENGEWCGITGEVKCCALGYPCCKETFEATYTDENGKWAIENDEWCEVKEKPKEPEEQQYSFGYALKNKPVPSKGCGKNPTLPKTGSFEFSWSGGRRTVRIDIPNNYNNQNPYRLVFGMHCMGGWAGGV